MKAASPEGKRIPIQKRTWQEAIARWDEVVSQHPDEPIGYLGMGIALREAKLFGLAECFLQSATKRFPRDAQLATEHGWVPLARKDWPAALARWLNLAQTHPDSTRVQADYGFVLLSAGRYDEAEQLLTQAKSRFPNYLGIAINHALVSNAKTDWPESIKFWTALYKTYPGNKQVLDGLGAARFGQSMLLTDTASAPSGIRKSSDLNSGISMLGNDVADRAIELVKKFESIGENCEFGLFQRAVGAEPLGLLRFAGISPTKLVAALDCDFQGVGTPEYTVLRDSFGEYVTSDTRFGMVIHTFIQPSTVSHDVTYASMLRRLSF